MSATRLGFYVVVLFIMLSACLHSAYAEDLAPIVEPFVPKTGECYPASDVSDYMKSHKEGLLTRFESVNDADQTSFVTTIWVSKKDKKFTVAKTLDGETCIQSRVTAGKILEQHFIGFALSAG